MTIHYLIASADDFNWMPVPQSMVPGCPAGLEYLSQIDRLLVSRFREGRIVALANSTVYHCVLCICRNDITVQTFLSTTDVFFLSPGVFQSTRTYRVRNAQGQDVFNVEEGMTVPNTTCYDHVQRNE